MNGFAGDGSNRAGRQTTTSAGPGGGATPDRGPGQAPPARSTPSVAFGKSPPAGHIPRFDAEARFAELEDREKAFVGEWALALATSMMARGALTLGAGPPAAAGMAPLLRAHEAAVGMLIAGPGFEAIADIAVRRAIDVAAVTTLLGRVCRECGCSQFDACHPGEDWAEEPADPGSPGQAGGLAGASGLDGLCATCAAGLEAEAMADYALPCAVKLPVKGGGEVTIRQGAKLSTLYEALRARDGQELTFGGPS